MAATTALTHHRRRPRNPRKDPRQARDSSPARKPANHPETPPARITRRSRLPTSRPDTGTAADTSTAPPPLKPGPRKAGTASRARCPQAGSGNTDSRHTRQKAPGAAGSHPYGPQPAPNTTAKAPSLRPSPQAEHRRNGLLARPDTRPVQACPPKARRPRLHPGWTCDPLPQSSSGSGSGNRAGTPRRPSSPAPGAAERRQKKRGPGRPPQAANRPRGGRNRQAGGAEGANPMSAPSTRPARGAGHRPAAEETPTGQGRRTSTAARPSTRGRRRQKKRDRAGNPGRPPSRPGSVGIGTPAHRRDETPTRNTSAPEHPQQPARPRPGQKGTR